jgi:hypothetical protein
VVDLDDDHSATALVCPGNGDADKLSKNKNNEKRKKNALVFCRDRKRFWTTQKQFWQWVRDGVVLKIGDRPLTGSFVRADEENLIMLGHTVLNRACKEHLVSALAARRLRTFKVRRHACN